MGQSSKTTQAQTGSQDFSTQSFSNPTFGDDGKSLLQSLIAAQQGGGNAYTKQAGAHFASLLGGQNPYAQQVVDAMDQRARRDYLSRLRDVRTAGFRGGAGSDFINQAGLASDFTNALEENKARLLLDSFNADRIAGLTAASGLQGLGEGRDASGTQLLSLLRGETSGTTGSATSAQDMRSRTKARDDAAIAGAVVGALALF